MLLRDFLNLQGSPREWNKALGVKKSLLGLREGLSVSALGFELKTEHKMLRVMSRDENIADWDAFCDRIEVKSCKLWLEVEPRRHMLLGDSILGKVKSYWV